MDGSDLKFSVVTVTYNLIDAGRRETFRQTIESVNTQSHPFVECIVIDGASDDGTVELIEDLKDKGMIDTFLSEPDDGLYFAMNKGADLASGDYILFLNSDDFYHDNDGLAEMAALLARTKADFCFGPCYVMDENGNERYQPGVMDRVVDSMRFCHQTMALKRSVFDDYDGFDPEIAIAADYDLVLRLVMGGASSVRSRANMVTYRTGGISGTSSVTREQLILVWLKNYSKYYPIKKSDMNTFFATKSLPIGLILGFLGSRDLSAKFKVLLGRFLIMVARRRVRAFLRKVLLLD